MLKTQSSSCDGQHCRMQLLDQAQLTLFGEPAFFLRSWQQCRRWSSTVKCMLSVAAEGHVEQGGKGCVSVFGAAGTFPALWPLGTVA